MAEKANWDMLKQNLLDDEKFDEWLSASLKPVSPPEDFSARVMAAIAAEPAPAMPAKVVRFPLRRVSAGLGACAAALLLFAGVSLSAGGDAPTLDLTNKPVQLAAEPAITMPDTTTDQPFEITPVQPEDPLTGETPAETLPPVRTADNTEPTVNEPTVTEPTPEVKDGELILPRTAYGTEASGSLSTRMVAAVEGNKLYQPSFAGKNAVFNTADDVNVYSWRVDLANPSEPQVSMIAAQSDLADASAMLQNTTRTIDATSLVTSPDKTMLAQNSADGIWISLLDGDVFQLTQEGNGNLLAWSPDSSKLVFTNANGALFVGYPLERRIYQLAEGNVKDICWNSDNKTLIYIATEGDQDALYIVELY